MDRKGYIFCRACREVNDLSDDFCVNCGNKLDKSLLDDEPPPPLQIQKNTKTRTSKKARQKKFSSSAAFILIILLTIVFVINNKRNDGLKNNSTTADVTQSTVDKSNPISVTVDTLIKDLNNIDEASNKYKGKYVEVTGKLMAVDSSGSNFAIGPMIADSSGLSVICFADNEEKSTLAELKSNQTITVLGVITELSNSEGYYLDDSTIVIK